MRIQLAQRARAATVALFAVFTMAVSAQSAVAQTYPDVAKSYWAVSSIGWTTDQGPAGKKLLDDYSGSAFKPSRAITRRQLARALVIASGHQDDTVTPVFIADVVPDVDPDYWEIEIALSLGLMTQSDDGFHPDNPAPAWQVDKAVVKMLQLIHTDDDWTMLSALAPATWEPVAGWKTGAPAYLPYEIAARSLGLRFNHPDGSEALEVSPMEPMSRAETAYVFDKALRVEEWRADGLKNYASIQLPDLSARQKSVIAFALKYVGYPYIWGGEYPTKASPYGTQGHGGFDCSGFVWWVLKIHFDYPVPDSQRTAAAMAAAAKPRISRGSLKPGDVIFFGYDGPSSPASQVYHTGLYIGRGWFVHSTGSLGGVGVSSLNYDSYWKATFAWGRRVLRKSELATVSAAASATP